MTDRAMKDNLVERLNAVVPYQGKSSTAFLCHEAAARIASLEAEVARLRESMERAAVIVGAAVVLRGDA